jgi:tRNA G10  N-methylase Trm11
MRYAFVLGRVHTLSIAELLAVFERPDASVGLVDNPVEILDSSKEVLVIETEKPLMFGPLQKKLGGVVKILRIVDILEKRKQDSVNFALKNYFKPSLLKKEFFKEYKGKKQFGVSVYVLDEELLAQAIYNRREDFRNRDQTLNSEGEKAAKAKPTTQPVWGEPKRIGMMIKKTLQESGLSVRVVLPEFNSLSLASVVVTKNLLLEKGAEIVLIAGKDKVYTAKTLVVQDFEDYGRRDYQRPIRDEQQGMIPPKVAQIMLNLSDCKQNENILDPFCGIGTIVQEGLLLGFRMFGSDINRVAIRGSEQNLEWFRNRYHIPAGKYMVNVSNAKEVSKLINKTPIHAIVTEGTLGPVYSQFPKMEDIEKNFQDLEKLYIESFKDFSKFLSNKAKIVMCVPAYKKGRDAYIMMPNLDWAKDLGYNLLELIPRKAANQMKFLRLTDRKTAIYDRKDQIVAREIVIFEKI